MLYPNLIQNDRTLFSWSNNGTEQYASINNRSCEEKGEILLWIYLKHYPNQYSSANRLNIFGKPIELYKIKVMMVFDYAEKYKIE